MPFGIFHDISARIRQVRGKKQKAKFADILGIPRPNFYKYEDGRKPPADVLQKIADYGGVTVKWLLTGKEEEKVAEGLAQSGHPEPLPKESAPARPGEIQEFLLAEVLRAILKYVKRDKLRYTPEYMARLISLLYNHCARTLEPPSESLVIRYDTGPQ